MAAIPTIKILFATGSTVTGTVTVPEVEVALLAVSRRTEPAFWLLLEDERLEDELDRHDDEDELDLEELEDDRLEQLEQELEDDFEEELELRLFDEELDEELDLQEDDEELELDEYDDEELEELDRHDDEEDRHEEELLEDLQLDDDEELLLLDEEDNDIELELKPVAMSPKAMEIEFQNPNPEVAVKAMILLAFGMGRSLVSFRSVVTKIFALSVCPNPGVIFTPDTLDIKLTSIELVDKVVISVIISLLTPLSLLMASTIRANCITL